nr:biopolymer transporter ExbD [uncultured Flavobacterium sp.]
MKNLPLKIRSKKLESRVDLTAMVSVSFLLIVFFMVTIDLAKPKNIDLDFSHNRCCDCPIYSDYGENRSITLILGENNKLIYYMGLLNSPIISPKEIKYGKDGIGKELTKRKNSLLKYTNEGKKTENLIVIIKPSAKCNYKNLVDILDEMAIAKIDSYSIINDFTPEESQLLAAN